MIDQVQKLLPSPSSFSLESNLKISLKELLVQEETLWKSKFKEIWLTCSDLNTKIFHTSSIIRRRANAINFLKTNEGSWSFDRAEIGGNFVNHFTNLFSSTSPIIEEELLDLFPSVISDEENQVLCSIPTEVEVVIALYSLSSSKAPGLDGFTALFYKKYWLVVRCEVLNCVWDFFLNKNLSREQNHTFITLVPKQSGCHSVHQFRPISLCNISCKII